MYLSRASVSNFEAVSRSSLSIKHITPTVRCSLSARINNDSSKPQPEHSRRTLAYKNNITLKN